MVDSVVGNSNGIRTLSELQASKNTEESKGKKELGQDVFLKLMVTQMKNQNPLDPQDNSEFVAQLAQFSSVEALDKLNKNSESMAASFQSSQALHASSMVGRTVKVIGSEASLNADKPVVGTAILKSSTTNLEMNVYNSAGELVDKQKMGSQAAGDLNFEWTGKLADGKQLPPGNYRFEMLSKKIDGEVTSVDTALSTNVNSVTVGQGGKITLNIDGAGSANLSDIKEIL